ncbi:ABC transporter substrate-binding protein [Cohnella herbarum]|uniref:Sugar ABC transporter substrate-binding protein n=1 Tax=Cohnella herbarum TaxID=2728023 RepID=A0A7Z2ZQ60_9BACL|nr:sugar ABC transporter substrate-binding protein [Cohnella herbarum]QJD86692.1 sugar ABC transporter substrate-binding protein [Cohnella herbarum]
MRKKNLLTLTSTLLLSFTMVLSGCGNNGGNNASPSSSSPASTPAGESASPSASASSDAGEPVTLTAFLFNMDKRQALEQSFKKFTEQNPNITVDLLVNDQDYYTVLKTKIASNDMPDIVMGEYGDLLELGQAGHILDLAGDSYIGNYSEQIRSQMTTPDGKIYGIPLDISGMGIYYNKDLFKEAGIESFPKTQTELLAAIDKLKAKKISPFGLAVADGWTLAHTLFTTIAGTTDDVKTLAESAKAGQPIQSDRLKQGFKTLDAIYGNADPQAASNNYNASLSLLAQGKVAMLQQGYWAYSSITDINPDVNLGFGAIPYSDNADEAKMGVNVNVSYAITSKSAHQDAAKKLFEWLTTKEGNAIANENMKQIPAIEGVTVSSNPIADDILSYVNAQKVVPWSQVLMNGSTRVEAEAIMQGYFFKKKTADEVVSEIATSWAKK